MSREPTYSIPSFYLSQKMECAGKKAGDSKEDQMGISFGAFSWIAIVH